MCPLAFWCVRFAYFVLTVFGGVNLKMVDAGTNRVFQSNRMRSGSRFKSGVVLSLNDLRSISFGQQLNISGPVELGLPARVRPLHLFNPSLVASPKGLCPQCAYVASLRADVLHQCDESNAYETREIGMPSRVALNAWFKGTVIAVLDADLRVLGWTWLLVEPAKQVLNLARRSGADGSRSGWFVPPGVSDGFAPPWSGHAFDARLFNLDDRRIIITFLKSCHAHQPCNFGISQLQLTGQPTPDGGVRKLRAWVHPTLVFEQPWVQGRNQALFTGEDGTLFVQPWLGLIASLGRPRFESHRVRCDPWDAPAEPGVPQRKYIPPWERRAIRNACGSHMAGTVLESELLAPDASSTVKKGDIPGAIPGARAPLSSGGGFGQLRLEHDHTARFNTSMWRYRALEEHPQGGERRVAHPSSPPRPPPRPPHRSLTTNLVRISRGPPARPCVALLGIGHVHRSEGRLTQDGDLTRRQQRRQHARMTPRRRNLHGALPSAAPFVFGADYDHYFFTHHPRPPFEPLGVSDDFCLSSAQDAHDCERVQFVSGLTGVVMTDSNRTPTDSLLLAFGVNDCEARVGRISFAQVWGLLRPIAGSADVCAPASSDL